MQALAKAAQQVAGKAALDVSNTAQLRDICLAAARIFGWKRRLSIRRSKRLPGRCRHKPGEAGGITREAKAAAGKDTAAVLPAANTPTLPAAQMQPDRSTDAEAVVVADQEPSIVATARMILRNPLFLQGWEKEPELPRRSTHPHSRRGWWYWRMILWDFPLQALSEVGVATNGGSSVLTTHPESGL